MSKLRSLNQEFISNIKTHNLVTDSKRNLILSILKSTTTKREAKNYLNKYQNQFDFTQKNRYYNPLLNKESQRELFVNRFLNRQNPFSNIYNDEELYPEEDIKVSKIPLRIAIFKIKFQTISKFEWKGIFETFKRLIHLGISPIILLDYENTSISSFKLSESKVNQQINKAYADMDGLEGTNGGGDFKITHLRSLYSVNQSNELVIDNLEMLLLPLYQDIIPIIHPVIYNSISTYQEFTTGDDDLLKTLSESLMNTKGLLSIEKIILIDPIGGIPSVERNQTSHVYINLSQEYSDIISELFIGYIEPSKRDLHLKNLNVMNEILHMISTKSGNDDTTGIITTPYIMSINNDQLNPIIYNVLTDRPIISSSLPSTNNNTPRLSTSILKKGIDVQIFDQNNYHRKLNFKSLSDDGLIDMDKLIALINDSFGKELDAENYFKRVENNLATLIILGDYDGAAIITWETIDDPHSKDQSEKIKVAYLDKFVIAKKNQGLPSLADIIFKIVLQSHPYELIWRSRKNNPVNKWYFERCCGSLSNPDSQWKIFYTGELFNKKIDKMRKRTPESVDIGKKMVDYSNICEGIVPSFK
ncbi:DUF619-domain-containing protein [Suhomyces tanzawaensis NRRL Y-17324]|uniref:Amino-acid acetyltransferase, mitochondrial n=1 Tax=Suhomyces tanzawaensis NRRL Y-17324 TaxID=984487 RepID=A0A1E4SND9_9ASCO|nr:DUF619-domain-containing protein [Suhomyces tanzawaensis NRRL Y-17324]ODV80937.1 DUF619-domain-containing protein [Suhomyces tanzawaensis NRRL Y-17324]